MPFDKDRPTLEFVSVAQACRVLRPYKTTDKIRALIVEGFNLPRYTIGEIAEFIGASRERTTTALVRLGMRRHAPRATGKRGGAQ